MTNKHTPNRRNFLKTAGIAATAIGATPQLAFANGQSQTSIHPLGEDTYSFDRVYSRIGVNSIKWDAMIKRYGKNKIIVPMGIADTDFLQFPPSTTAILKRATNENYGYETVPDSYYQTIIDWNRERYGVDLKRSWIGDAAAIKPTIIAALRGLLPSDSKVLIQTPTYSGFPSAIKEAGMRVDINPLKQDSDKWYMDLADLERRIDDETKCLILCNPNNPTGNCWTEEELKALGDICLKHNILVLADEIHCDILNKGAQYTPYSSLGEEYARSSITLKSVSKTFSQPSLKTAYFYTSNNNLMEAVVKKGGLDVEINTFGVVAAQAAYREGAAWVDGLKSYINENFDYLVNFVNRPGSMPGIRINKPDATYLAWLDCNELARKIATPAHIDSLKTKWEAQGNNSFVDEGVVIREWLIENSGVQINAGHAYGPGSEGFLRMNIAVPREQLTLALDKMNTALQKT